MELQNGKNAVSAFTSSHSPEKFGGALSSNLVKPTPEADI